MPTCHRALVLILVVSLLVTCCGHACAAHSHSHAAHGQDHPTDPDADPAPTYGNIVAPPRKLTTCWQKG